MSSESESRSGSREGGGRGSIETKTVSALYLSLSNMLVLCWTPGLT